MNSDFYTHMVNRQREIELQERAAQDRLAREARRANKRQRADQREVEELRAVVEGRKPRHGVWGAIRGFFAGQPANPTPAEPDPVDRFVQSDRSDDSQRSKPTANMHPGAFLH